MAELARPGVRVTQEFRTTSPTFLTPSMPACVVGPCNQVVEAVQDDGTFNSEALITLPARLVFDWVTSPFEYASIGGDALGLEVNNGSEQLVTFPGSGNVTVDAAVAAVNSADIAGIVAKVEISGTQKRMIIETTTTGDNASLRVGASTVADVLAVADTLSVGYTSVGKSGYHNYLNLTAQPADYPDPRDNIDQLDIDYDTVRVFVNDGAGTVKEATRTSTFLDGATSAVTVQDDGDSDNLSPYLNFAGGVFRQKAAVLTGTVDWSGLTYPGDFGTSTLELIVNGATVLVTFANPGNAAAAAATVHAALGVNGSCALNGSNQPVITSAILGANSSILVGSGGTINEATIGLAVGSYAAGKQSKARAQGTVDITALTYATQVQGYVLRMSIDGDDYQTLTIPTSVTNASQLVAALNARWPNLTASLSPASRLVMMSDLTHGGKDSSIRIDKLASSAALLTNLGLTTAGGPFETTEVVFGAAYAPIVGDEVWVDGIRKGVITEIVAGLDNRLRIDTEQLLTFTGSTWVIKAMGLDNDLPDASRPGSDLYIDPNSGRVQIKAGLFLETGGVVPKAGPLATYVGYTALRLDVSPAGTDFSILTYGSSIQLEAELGPLDTSNPLGLGMYVAILNAPGVAVHGVGVDEITDAVPEGTTESYVRAFEFLESKDVYAIAVLTHSLEVGVIGQVHVDAMSDPSISLERYVLFNPERPTRKSSTLVASSLTANVAGAPTDTIETGIATLQALLAAAGKPGPTYSITDGVYIELEDDANKYLVESVSGGTVVINDGALTTGNEDGFYFDANAGNVFTTVIVDRPCSVKIRGAALANRDEEAAAYADIARGFADRRVVVTAPDQAAMTIDGLETIVPGYYMNCAVAGMRSARAPQQPLTNESIAGFTRCIGSQDRYSERQLRMMSGGGLFVFQQDNGTGPVKIRHQLTSDMSTVEKREDNIRTAMDYAAKFFRTVLTNFIGRFVLTTQISDAVNTVLSGAARLLVEQGVFLKCEIVAFRVNADDPTKLDVDVQARAPYPLNTIDITLTI